MELSQCLAKHGFKITFVNAESNHQLIKNASTSSTSSDQINLVSISDDAVKLSSDAVLRVMPSKVEELIEQLNDKISCIIADQSIGWALEIAERKGIRRAAFCPAAAAQLVLGFSIPKLIQDGIIDDYGTPTKKEIVRISPTMPAMNTANFVWACLGNMESQKNIFKLMLNNNKSIKLTDWLLCNSIYDLEPAAFNLAPQIIPIGPVSEINRQRLNSTGNFWAEDSTCLRWLDQQKQQSVIYVAFGSFAVFDPKQFQELALGLELSKKPFLWVVRPDIKSTNNAFLEEFRERVGNLGKIVSWAPQKKVLAHKSVSCFVSHCGWNSTMEGVSNGVPFLCWPYFADQFFNQRYICDIWKIGLELDRNENGIIVHLEIKNKVEQVLGNGEFRKRALDLKELVVNSVEEGGSSYQNFKRFIEWMRE
ncbi:hypothetical protein JCGZ_19931 [Jatropha curcas]|uniref:Anthocyanidin 3-O-glucosyltransferase n=2 Tax=Jatropha curcas TaxID=180498 RepID=A0A067JTP4_JATCU|nr:hypothetical protein JCGZ_19931 [Jatropha curcas]